MSTDMKKPAPARGRANSNTTAKLDPTTQQWRVLQALRDRPMSAAELQWELRIAHAPSVVRELIAKGIPVKTLDYPNPNPDTRCKVIRRYCLVESE